MGNNFVENANAMNVDGTDIKFGSTNIANKLESNKEVDITEGGLNEILPSEGKMAMCKVSANVNYETENFYFATATINSVITAIFYANTTKTINSVTMYNAQGSLVGGLSKEAKANYWIRTGSGGAKVTVDFSDGTSIDVPNSAL